MADKFTKQEIVDGVEDFVATKSDKAKKNWYVGITNDPDRRLEEHNVDTSNHDGYIVFLAETQSSAHDAEIELEDLGYDGDTGGDANDSKFVYAFHETSDTDPAI